MVRARRGRENGLPLGEVYWFRDEFDHLPGLKDYLGTKAVTR